MSHSPQEDQHRGVPPRFPTEEGLWLKHHFRLFLSYNSKDREPAEELKKALASWGIDVFVAHANVRPASEWRAEVKLALQECHALGALLTHNFYKSKWTDQEVGFAVGRGITMIPLSCGAKPRGFLSDFQAFNLNLNTINAQAEQIAQVLARNPSTRQAMSKALTITGRKKRTRRKSGASKSQPNQIPNHGLFAGTEPNFFDGEDLDVPTYLRLGMKIDEID